MRTHIKVIKYLKEFNLHILISLLLKVPKHLYFPHVLKAKIKESFSTYIILLGGKSLMTLN